MAEFNLPDSALQVFWDKFGENAYIDRGDGYKPIRIIDMNKVVPQNGGFDVLGLTEVMSYKDVILIRPQEVRQGNRLGYKIRKNDNKEYYVVNPTVSIVGVGEWVLSGSPL